LARFRLQYEPTRAYKRWGIQFPGIANFIRRTKAFAEEKGYVQTLYKRRRYLPDIPGSHSSFARKSYAERQAVNTVIQGSAADILKSATLKLREKLLQLGRKEKKTVAKIVFQFHGCFTQKRT